MLGAVVVAALGGLGWSTAPSLRPTPPDSRPAPTVRELALASWEDLTLREEAIRVLGFVGTEAELPLLEAAVADPRWTGPAARALIDLLGPDAMDVLEPYLSNRWFEGRRSLVLALGHAHDDRSAERLVELFETSRQSWITYAAALALTERKEPRAMEPFIREFQRNGNNAERLAIYPVDSPAREVLRQAVRSGRRPHASNALGALAEVEDPHVLELLEENLTARDPWLRHGALEALGALDDPRAVPLVLSFESRIDSDADQREWMHSLWKLDTPETRARAFDVLENAPAGLARAVVGYLPDSTLRDLPGAFVDLAERRPGAVGDAIVEKLLEAEWDELPGPVLELARQRLPTNDSWWRVDDPARLLYRFGTPNDRRDVTVLLNRLAESGAPRALYVFEAIPGLQRTEEHVEALVTLLTHTSNVRIVDKVFARLGTHLDDERRVEIALSLLDRVAVDSVMEKALSTPEGRAHVERFLEMGTRTEQMAARAALGDGEIEGARFSLLRRRFGATTTEPLETFDAQVRALDSQEPATVRSALLELSESTHPGAAHELERLVLEGGPYATDAAYWMKSRHTERAEALVDLFMDDPDPKRRVLAMDLDRTLAFGFLSDEDPQVREAAIPRSATDGSSFAASRVRDLLDDDDEGVAAAAARALKGLGGRHAREEADRIEELLP